MNATVTSSVGCLAISLTLLTGCEGPQSALDGKSADTEPVLLLTWIMFTGAALILALVMVAIGIAICGSPSWRGRLGSQRFIVGWGLVFPIVTLSALLVYGFWVMRLGVSATSAESAIKIAVVGHQWWWRVIYLHADGTATEAANEIHVPVGTDIELALSSADVLHSFWVPAYAGKVDMVPGRTNTLRIRVREPGIARGQCAEYCGGAHALMAFHVIAASPDDYAAWLEQQRSPAAAAAQSAHTEPGRMLFFASGCAGCHTIRGLAANGGIGPDLTHVGSRLTIGAGTLARGHAAFGEWLARHQTIKPENKMPPYDFFTAAQRDALANFLLSLE